MAKTATRQEVLEFIFGPQWGEAWVTGFAGDPGKDGRWQGGRAKSLLATYPGTFSVYAAISLMMASASSRSIANIQAIYALFVDDVGTKFDENDVLRIFGARPNIVTETSPKNFQWLYVLAAPITDKRVHKLIMDTFFTQVGKIESPDAARYFRLPESTNGKNGQNFPVVSRIYAVPKYDPAQMLGASVDAVTKSLGPALLDTGRKFKKLGPDDFWFDKIQRAGLFKHMKASGDKAEITCPWESEHTTGPDGTAYMGDGRFKCQHGHCAKRDHHHFKGVICEMVGGPQLVAREYFSHVGDEDGALVSAVEADVLRDRAERRERELDRIFARYVFVKSVKRFYDLEHPDVPLDNELFAICVKDWQEVGRGGVRSAAAMFHNDPRSRVLDGLNYVPGEGRIVTKGNRQYLNQWSEPAGLGPLLTGVQDADVQIWLDTGRRLYPDPEMFTHVLDFQSYVLQNPGKKINWALITLGDQGTGKDSFWYAFARALAQNHKTATMEDFRTDFNGRWILAQALCVEEIAAGSARFDLYNKLKPYVAAPPDMLTVRQKYMTDYDIDNRLCVYGFTNNPDAIPLAQSDRRWLIYASPAKAMTKDQSGDLWSWYELGGGLEKVRAYLMERKISAGFDPKRCPDAVGTGKAVMMRAALSPAAEWVADEMENWNGLVTIEDVLGLARQSAPKAVQAQITKRAVAEGLRAIGGAPLAGGHQVRLPDGRKVRLWATIRVGMYEQMTPKQLGDAYLSERGKREAGLM